jgi:hypothetical protein
MRQPSERRSKRSSQMRATGCRPAYFVATLEKGWAVAMSPTSSTTVTPFRIGGLSHARYDANVPYVEFAKGIKRLAILSAFIQSHCCLYTVKAHQD